MNEETLKITNKDIEKLERHLGKGEVLRLKNEDGTEDEFYFEPLGVEFLPKVAKMANASQLNVAEKEQLNQLEIQYNQNKITKEQYKIRTEDIKQKASLRTMDGENAVILTDLLIEMVKNSYPNLSERKINQFIYNNLIDLQVILMKLNQHLTVKNTSGVEQVKRLKQKFIGTKDETS